MYVWSMWRSSFEDTTQLSTLYWVLLCSDKVTNEGGVLTTSPKPNRGSYNCLLSRGWNNGNIGRKDKDIASIDIGEPVMAKSNGNQIFDSFSREPHHTKDRLEAIRASKRDHEETTQNDSIRQQSAGPKTYQIRMINGSPGSCWLHLADRGDRGARLERKHKTLGMDPLWCKELRICS